MLIDLSSRPKARVLFRPSIVRKGGGLSPGHRFPFDTDAPLHLPRPVFFGSTLPELLLSPQSIISTSASKEGPASPSFFGVGHFFAADVGLLRFVDFFFVLGGEEAGANTPGETSVLPMASIELNRCQPAE